MSAWHPPAVSEPPGVARLPHDDRGVPIPAHVARIDGQPVRLTEFDPNRLVVLAAERRCTICGWVIGSEELCWWPSEPDLVDRARASGWATWEPVLEGAGHRECMFFAAISCPFLSIPNYQTKAPQRSGAAVVHGKGTERGPILLCGAPVEYVRVLPGRDPEVVLGGGEREVRAYSDGVELVPDLEEQLRAHQRSPQPGDIEFANLMASTDNDAIGVRYQQRMLEVMIRNGATVPATDGDVLCYCGSGLSHGSCCERRRIEAEKAGPYPF